MGNKGQTTQSTYNVPSWESTDWQNLISQTSNQTNADIASVNQPQIQGQFQQGTQGILNQQVDPNALSTGITSGAGSSSWTNPGVAKSYMNPYEDTALASTVGLERSTLLNPALAGIDRSAAAAHALGGSRGEVERAQTTNNFNQQMGNTIAQGENTAYQTGEQQYSSDAARQLAAKEAAAQTQLAGANSNIYSNFAAGQNNLNAIAASEAPEQQLATEAGILGNLPKQGTQQTTTTPNGGAGAGILGGILGGAGQLLGAIKPFGFSEGGIVDTKKKKKPRHKKGKKAGK